MRKLYLDLEFISCVPEAYQMSANDLSIHSGMNFGNFPFRHALRFIIDDLPSYSTVTYQEIQKITEDYVVDKVIISAANWLGISEHDERVAQFRSQVVEQLDCEFVTFGLGVQAQLNESLQQLGPNTLRLAKILSERCKALSVRDQLTQDTLAAEGIRNTVVTGCPSNFINDYPRLGKDIAKKARRKAGSVINWQDLRIYISEATPGHPLSGTILQDNLLKMAQNPAFYIIQSPLLLPFIFGESEDLPEFYTANNPLNSQHCELEKVLKSKTIHFSQMDAWLDFARTCNISLGMRIHGTMMPIQAGVPSVLIVHDSRTSGLAKTMGIPWLTPEDYISNFSQSPAKLLEFIADRMAGYDKKRKSLAKTMLTFLDDNGLPSHPSIRNLASFKDKNRLRKWVKKKWTINWRS